MERVVEALEEKIYRLIDKIAELNALLADKDLYITEIEKKVADLTARDEQNKEKIAKLIDTINNVGL